MIKYGMILVALCNLANYICVYSIKELQQIYILSQPIGGKTIFRMIFTYDVWTLEMEETSLEPGAEAAPVAPPAVPG